MLFAGKEDHLYSTTKSIKMNDYIFIFCKFVSSVVFYSDSFNYLFYSVNMRILFYQQYFGCDSEAVSCAGSGGRRLVCSCGQGGSHGAQVNFLQHANSVCKIYRAQNIFIDTKKKVAGLHFY
jgi:hypothetical protein